VETIEKGLSNLQNEVVVVKTTLSEHTETLRMEEHHNSMEQLLHFIDNERTSVLNMLVDFVWWGRYCYYCTLSGIFDSLIKWHMGE
jgi:hypothetical protein